MMPDSTKVNWQGQSGQSYAYTVYSRQDTLPEVPGNYIWAVEHSPRQWQPIYFGETERISQEMLDDHPSRDCIIMNGATHIHVHENSGDRNERQAEAIDLTRAWNAACND